MDFDQKSRHFTGQLYKYTNVMKGWQFRYFFVDCYEGVLHYYLLENGRSVPRGSVHLAGAVICPSEEDSKTFTVNCASGDMLKLRATDARERQEWVNKLRAVAEAHTKTISANSTPLRPHEHLDVIEAITAAKAQITTSEQTHTKLCQALETSSSYFFTDPNLLMLKATSAASLHCLFQCLHLLQREQHQQQGRTGFVIDDD
ncbi:oxysterol-binding protein-related protein 11 [Atheta coriaria]|uniref:oxysterol-binding protein-related protein 11 n=1 Tax=Dalotia coriaria TaxID=877792 RepID=UPI0031F46859